MAKQKLMKTKKLSETLIVTIMAIWVDTSFTHAFGTEVQGHYELTHILMNGAELPLDILSDQFLDQMEDYINAKRTKDE